MQIECHEISLPILQGESGVLQVFLVRIRGEEN